MCIRDRCPPVGCRTKVQVTEEKLDTVAGVITISLMTEHDLLEVVEIEEESALSRWGWAAYYAELQGMNRSLMLVASVSNQSDTPKKTRIAGYIVARLSAGELHINNVAVRSEFRQRGIGSVSYTHLRAHETPEH